MSLEKLLGNLSIQRVKSDVEHICSAIPSRLPGSPNGDAMAAYSARSLEAAGLKAEVHKIPGLVSFPEAAELSIDLPGIAPMAANSLAHSAGAGVPAESELVYVGSGSEAECRAAGVKGKIILCQLSYAPARQEKERIAALCGAKGAVMFNWGHDDSDAVPMGSLKAAWGNPTPDTYRTQMPTLPCIGISRRDGLKLKALCEQGPAFNVSYQVHSRDEWQPVAITVGEIPSPSSAKELVLAGGHQDSWFGEAATDNAAGSACLLELARAFSPLRGTLRRSIIFGFWAGHETGTMIGSTWFAETYWDRLRAGLVAYLQIDQPGLAGSTVWNTACSEELRSFAEAIDGTGHPGCERRWSRPAKMGDTSFFGLGAPLLQAEGSFTEDELATSGGATLGWWHHSLACTIDKVDWDQLEAHLHQYARYLHGLAASPVVPTRFAGSASFIRNSLRAYDRDLCRIDIAPLIAAADRLQQSAASFDKAMDALSQIPSPPDSLIGRANSTARAVCGKLVPITATACDPYEQDSYGLTAQAAALPPLADIERHTTDEPGPRDWMLQTRLRRNRNRVMDALIEAETALAEAARDIAMRLPE